MYGELPEIKLTDGGSIRGIALEVPNPPKTCVVRLPTNDELTAYLSVQRSIYRDLGRGNGETEDVPNPKADRKLFEAIRIDKNGEEFDDAEALYVIGQITRHRVVSCERDGQTYVVVLGTLFGEVKHVVSIPFQKDLSDYRRGVYKARQLRSGVTEQRFPPDAPVKLYDKIVVAYDGYLNPGEGEAGPRLASNGHAIVADCVPPDHKRTVIIELLTALASLDPSLDPNS